MQFEVIAKRREAHGKGASRRLRHAGFVPGILYGGEAAPQAIELAQKDLLVNLRNEAFHASILSLNLEGTKEPVLLRDVQMHPVRIQIVHVDFQRVDKNQKIHMKVPLHFRNEDIAPGVKLEGGQVSHILTEIEIQCLPERLPEYIEVDVKDLHGGQSIHASQLTIPEGVEVIALVRGENPVVVAILLPKGGAEEEQAAPAAAPAAPAAPAAA